MTFFLVCKFHQTNRFLGNRNRIIFDRARINGNILAGTFVFQMKYKTGKKSLQCNCKKSDTLFAHRFRVGDGG